MSIAKKIKVQVKRDHLSQIASGSPELALAEMIWNALDADSTTVDVRFHEGPLGVDEITITDNGTGIPYGQAESLFEALGGFSERYGGVGMEEFHMSYEMVRMG